MSIPISNEIQEYWNQFIEKNPELSHLSTFKFEAWSFGNTKEMANELGQLVVAGKKLRPVACFALIEAVKMKFQELVSTVFFAMALKNHWALSI